MPRFPANGAVPSGAAQRIFTNTVYLLAADIANKLLALAFFVIAARHLGVERFGVLSYAIAYVTTLGVFADLGLALYVTREVARRRGDAGQIVGDAITLRTSASVLVGMLVALSVFVVGLHTEARGIVAICSVLVVANGLFLLLAGVFQGFERNVYTALSRIVQTGLLVLGALLLMRLSPRTDYFTWLFVGTALASAVTAYLLMVRRVVRPVLRFDWRSSLAMLRSALPMGISAVLVTAYYWNGSVWLAAFAGERAVGVFAAPQRLVFGIAALGMAFSGAMYPHMARVQAEGGQRLVAVLGRALRYVSLLAIPVAILGAVLATEAVELVYGRDYAESALVFRLLVVWGCFVFFNSLLSNYYYSADRARFATAQAGVSLCVNVVANILLIPRFGALGAAMALAGAELVGTAWFVCGVAREWSRSDHRTLAVGIAKCLVAAVGAALLGRIGALLGAPIALAVAAVCYFVLVLLLGAVSREDIELIKAMLVRRRRTDCA
ncbi:MAG TPA: flippase [candidate division WOR-3 bacterium]|uniref:Flippase n=1 Tax=candidate division WOR-3 bacterium TaxID=2052148 RepID=A0A7V0T6G9_UNCW3|nr:flippase [candidate division WOR-3 bacterium]